MTSTRLCHRRGCVREGECVVVGSLQVTAEESICYRLLSMLAHCVTEVVSEPRRSERDLDSVPSLHNMKAPFSSSCGKSPAFHVDMSTLAYHSRCGERSYRNRDRRTGRTYASQLKGQHILRPLPWIGSIARTTCDLPDVLHRKFNETFQVL